MGRNSNPPSYIHNVCNPVYKTKKEAKKSARYKEGKGQYRRLMKAGGGGKVGIFLGGELQKKFAPRQKLMIGGKPYKLAYGLKAEDNKLSAEQREKLNSKLEHFKGQGYRIRMVAYTHGTAIYIGKKFKKYQPKKEKKKVGLTPMQEEYEKETGKKAIWNGKETKGFKEFQRKKLGKAKPKTPKKSKAKKSKAKKTSSRKKKSTAKPKDFKVTDAILKEAKGMGWKKLVSKYGGVKNAKKVKSGLVQKGWYNTKGKKKSTPAKKKEKTIVEKVVDAGKEAVDKVKEAVTPEDKPKPKPKKEDKPKPKAEEGDDWDEGFDDMMAELDAL